MLPRSDLGGNSQQKKHLIRDAYLVQQFNCQPQFPVLRSENIQLPEDESSGSCTLPGLPSKYFRPHLVNRRRFQPACCFTAGKSDARRNLLQPVTEFTSVQRMQTKLTPISSKGVCLTFSNISRSPAVAAYRLTPELSGFSHILDKLASISLNGCV